MVRIIKEHYSPKYLVFAYLIFVQFSFSANIDTIFVYSVSMDTTLSNIIVIPENYKNDSTSFPVLYLLHGWSGDFDNWNSKTDLSAYSDTYDIIIVCPEGGYASWYLDSPVNPKSQFKTYVGKEVVEWVDANYRTINTRDGRAICGLSMGGHGAFYLSLEYPNTFGAIGSMSGVLDLSTTRLVDGIHELLGTNSRVTLDSFSVFYRLNWPEKTQPFILIDCGLEDKYIHVNRKVHKRLSEMGIEHSYLEEPGNHNWEYWTSHLETHIQFFKSSLNWKSID
ncbi:MAG: esterase family protein [Candidatus Marinimicrobia bacterium]|nr:esterase family protein [Candidatus Neomarinimicrobiota bacterium]